MVGSALPGGGYPEHTLATDGAPSKEQLRALHQCISKVSVCTGVEQKMLVIHPRWYFRAMTSTISDCSTLREVLDETCR